MDLYQNRAQIGKNIRFYRKSRTGHTMRSFARELAQELGSFSYEKLSKIEQGKRTCKYSELLVIAKLLGVSLEDLTRTEQVADSQDKTMETGNGNSRNASYLQDLRKLAEKYESDGNVEGALEIYKIIASVAIEKLDKSL